MAEEDEALTGLSGIASVERLIRETEKLRIRPPEEEEEDESEETTPLA